jgi:hypothetical protein
MSHQYNIPEDGILQRLKLFVNRELKIIFVAYVGQKKSRKISV